MILRHIVILSFILSVRSQEQEPCVLYTFGADYYELFDNVKNPCQSSWSSWALRNYDEVNFVGLHESGSYFIEAINNTQLSCVSSFNMWLTIGGFIEVNIYMLSTSNLDQFSAIVNLIDGNSGLGTVAGQGNFQPQEHFVPEWHTLRIYIDGSVSGLGYISFVGVVSSDVSILIVDSYRYVAPTIEPETCEIYEDNSTVTTETTPTQTTTETTTETEPSTIITTEPTTTEPPSTTNTIEEPTNSTTEAETTITITPEAEPTITTVTESTTTETESTTITEEATTIATTEPAQTTSEEPNSTTNIETESTTVTENTTASEPTSITESTTLITESTTLSTASTTLTTESASVTTESEPTIPELTTEISVTTSPQIGSSFWTPLTICMTITLSLILIILIGAISYLIGRNCRDKSEEDIVLSYYLDEGQWWFRLIPRAKMNKPSDFSSHNKHVN